MDTIMPMVESRTNDATVAELARKQRNPSELFSTDGFVTIRNDKSDVVGVLVDPKVFYFLMSVLDAEVNHRMEPIRGDTKSRTFTLAQAFG